MIKKEFINKNQCTLELALNENLGLDFILIKKIIRKGDVKVNNKRIKQNVLLQQNDKIVCYIPEPIIDVIYSDENLLIVNKPKKIETISEESDIDLTKILLKKYPTCSPCHRLDFNTSGLCVFSLNEMAEKEILSAFKEGKVVKKYLAIISGNVKKHEVFEDFLIKKPKLSQVQICSSMQTSAVRVKTEYNLVEKINDELSLVEVILHTGKTHQIRAHLAFNKLPVLGDRKYGNREMNEKYKKHSQCLASYSLKFDFSHSSLLQYVSNKEFVLTKEIKNIFNI